MAESEENGEEMRTYASTPTWSTATVLAFFVAISLIVERSIHRLTHSLKNTDRKSLLAALEKMKEELLLLGFMSLLLTATSRSIANICIPSRFYTGTFAPCSRSEILEEPEYESSKKHNLLKASVFHSYRRMLRGMKSTCKEGHEPFVSYEGLEHMHRFIFVMAITHVAYSCLTMLLAIVKIHRWRAWEDEAHKDHEGILTVQARQMLMKRQTSFVVNHRSNPLTKNRFLLWVICFFRQFVCSVVRTDYLTLRKGFIMNHHLISNYDFHSYMVRSMEEEFQKIVGISAPLWGFVVAFMLFNVKGFNLYFWMAIIPITLVVIVGAKLQQVMATLTLESAGITGYFTGARVTPRDELFWFKKPEWLLSLIHFILFQNSFELASFFWFWWQFGYNSCFLKNHTRVYIRIILGVAGQFICSYITLPLYALVTQMGTNFKAALIPRGVRETIHDWGKEARKRSRRKRKKHWHLPGDSSKHWHLPGDSSKHSDTSTAGSSSEEDHHQVIDIHGPRASNSTETELQPVAGGRSRRNFGSF